MKTPKLFNKICDLIQKQLLTYEEAYEMMKEIFDSENQKESISGLTLKPGEDGTIQVDQIRGDTPEIRIDPNVIPLINPVTQPNTPYVSSPCTTCPYNPWRSPYWDPLYGQFGPVTAKEVKPRWEVRPQDLPYYSTSTGTGDTVKITQSNGSYAVADHTVVSVSGTCADFDHSATRADVTEFSTPTVTAHPDCCKKQRRKSAFDILDK